jgi:hypothetical protein
MLSSNTIRVQVESALARKFRSALTASTQMVRRVLSTCIGPLDELSQAGLLIGAVAGLGANECSGQMSLALLSFSRVTAAGRVCAWIFCPNRRPNRYTYLLSRRWLPAEMNSVTAYAQAFGALTESQFEVEACVRLEHTVVGFQRVPAKPQGDGGLDGFSHHGERGYCCFGPIPNSFKNAKAYEKAIVTKFSSDLRRLCELKTERKSLKHDQNAALKDILPKGARLKEILLICNWFESHKVIGPLHTALADYLKASSCTFICPDASIQIIGPAEFAQRFYADELALATLQSRAMFQKVKDAATTLSIAPPEGFDVKIANLKLIRPGKEAVIDGLAENFRHDWRMNLAFEQELDGTLPDLHRALQEGRRRILARVNQRMLASATPWNELTDMVQEAREILRVEFGAYAAMVDDVSSGEIARLIGICPIDWEPS